MRRKPIRSRWSRGRKPNQGSSYNKHPQRTQHTTGVREKQVSGGVVNVALRGMIMGAERHAKRACSVALLRPGSMWRKPN